METRVNRHHVPRILCEVVEEVAHGLPRCRGRRSSRELVALCRVYCDASVDITWNSRGCAEKLELQLQMLAVLKGGASILRCFRVAVKIEGLSSGWSLRTTGG